MFSDHYGIELKISERKETGNFPHTWKLNNTF